MSELLERGASTLMLCVLPLVGASVNSPARVASPHVFARGAGQFSPAIGSSSGFGFADETLPALDVCSAIAGAAIVADDGTFLGTASNKFDSRSVLNEYADYGSKFSDNSIWNTFGSYGGTFSGKSPFNVYTSTPPVLVKDGSAIAYLSVNRSLKPAVNPYVLKTCEFY